MADIHATAEQIFEIIQELRAQLEQAEQILATPGVPEAGVLEVWERKTLSLIGRALGNDHFDYEAFQHAAGPMRLVSPMASHAQAQSIRISNLQNRLKPHIAPLSDAIEEAEKALNRVTGGVAPTRVAGAATGVLPQVDFTFVNDARLRVMAARDYSELRVAVFYGNVKAKALLAGSVVEAVVLDLLLQKGIPFEELKNLTAYPIYERAKNEGILAGRTLNAAHASRDGRNFVHPAVEYREGDLTPAQADLIVSLMRAVLGELRVI
jgi:hypothetical protein